MVLLGREQRTLKTHQPKVVKQIGVSPPGHHGECEIKDDDGATKKIAAGNLNDVGASNRETGGDLELSQKENIRKSSEVSGDLSPEISIGSNAGLEKVSSSLKSSGAIVEEGSSSILGEKSVECQRGKSMEISLEEESNGNKDVRKGRGRPRKKRQKEEGEAKEKECSGKDGQDNMVTSKASPHTIPTPLNEECPRRFSLRPRKKAPGVECTDPSVVNNSAQVPTEVSGECPIDSSSGKDTTISEAKKGIRDLRSTRKLVDYSDNSDSCDSMVHVNLALERTVRSEQLKVADKNTNEVAVGSQEYSERSQKPESNEAGSGVITEPDKDNQPRNIQNKYEPKGDIPCIMEESVSPAHSDEQLSQIQVYNDLRSESCQVLGSAIDEKSAQIVTNDSTTGAEDVGSLPCIENCLSSMDSLETTSAEDCELSIPESLSSSSTNDDSSSVAGPEEVNVNSCHSQEDQESEESEIESDVTLVDSIDCSEGLPHSGGILSPSNSSFSLSSDGSSGEYSDALSVLDKCEGDMVEFTNILEQDDADKKEACEFRRDAKTNVSAVPMLKDCIPSMSISESAESSTLGGDYSSPIAKRQMGNEPLQKSHDLNKLTGTEYPKKCTSNEIYNKEQLSLDDQHIHVQAKNLSHPVDEKLTKLVSSKGVDPPKIQQPMVKLSAEPDQKLSSNTCLSEENHALPVADGSQLIQVEKEKRAESSVLIPSSCQSHVIQAENSGKESVEKKHLKDFETFSERTFSMDDSNVKNSLPPIKDHPAKYSLGGSSSAKLLTSAPEKRRNLVGVAQHGKDISVIGGNAPSKEMKCRQTVPLLFGKLNLFRFPGVKFRISGCFASEFYPEPYLVPKFPLISFGHGDFHELYELLKEKNAAKQPKALVPLEVKFYKRGTFAPLNFTDLYLNPKRLSINMGHRRRKVNFIPEGDNNSSSLSDCVAECGHLNEDAFKDNSQICAPGLGYEENCESSSKDGSSTLGDDQESSCESMISVCDQVNVAVSSDVISNVFMSKVHGPKNASIHETKKSEPNVQICHEKEFSALRPGRAGSSEGLGGDQNNSGEIKQRDLDAQCEGDLASNGIDKSIGDLKQLAASDTVASNILMQEDPKKLKNDNLSNLTSQTEGIRPRGLGDKDENYRNIVQSANQDERDSNESRLKVKDKAGSGTCKNSVMSPCSEKPNVGVVTGKKDEDSLTHDLEIAEAVSRNEDNGGKLVEGKNMEQNSDGDMAGDEGIDDVIVTINPGGSTADTGLKPHSSSGSVIFDADESNLLQNRLPLNLPAKEGEEKGLMDVFAPERVNKVGHISEEKTQKELKANSSFKLKTGSNVFQNLFSEKSTCVNMSMQANSKPASLGITVVATNEIPEAARASDAMPIDKCLMAENFDGMSELAGRLQTFRGTEAIETSETISQEKSLNKLPIKTKSNNCTAIDVNLMDVSTHKSKESTSSSESMQGSTSISMEKERNGIKSFSVGSKDESTKDFSGEKRIGDNSSSPTKSKKKSNIDCTEERSMNEVSDECLDNKTEESISSSGSVSFAKRAIAKEASEKSLFGTDLSDASLDSEPVVDPVPISRRRKKRWTKIAYSSESEDGCEERKKENEEQSPPGKRIKLGGKKRKSFASKSNASFGLLPPNGSVDSVRTPDGVISQSPRRKADLPPNPSCGRAVAENTDEEGEPDDGLQSSINGSSAGPSSRKSNLNTTVTEDAIFDDNSKSDVDVPMPSVKGGHNKNSHLPIASAPPLCKGLSRIANYSPKTYASRKSKTLKNQSPILEAPKNVEAKDLNIPGKFCGVQTDNGLGANSVTSFPEEEETFSMSTKKGEIESTENVIKDTESTSKIPPATSPSGGKKNGKQSFIGSVRCDDATFIGEGGMEETTFLLEETGEGSLVNAVNAPGVCASASTGRKSKGTKNERVPPSPGRLNKKCGGKEDIVRDRTEQNGSSDECVANFPKVLTTVVECGTSSAKKSSLKLHSNWRCNKDESKPSIEEGQLRSVRESVSISKLHPKARNTKSKAKSSPEFVHSSESDSEGETKSLEGGRCNELVVYVAHASEASPKLTKDRSSFVMGKGSEDKVGSSEGEGKKEKHNAGVTGMIVNLNNTTMNSRKPRMHANKNNDEDSTNLSTDQLFRFPLKKGIGNISQATECLSSPTPTILKGYSSDGKVVAENNKKEEILLEESGTTPSFERHNVFATKLVPTGNDFVENKQKLNSFIERDALKQVSISSLPSFNSKGADLTRACNIGLGGGVNISGKIQPRVLSEDCVIDHGSSGFDKSSGDMKQFGASATLISNILVQEDPKKLKNNNLSNLTSQTEGVRPRGLRDNDENNRSIVQSADQGERDSDESRLKAKDEAESGTCKNSVMSPCFEKLNVGVVTGKKDKDSLTHDLEIAEAVSRNEDNGGKLVEGKNMEQNSDGDMGGDEVIDDIIMTIIPGDSMADIGLKTGSSTESVIFDSDDSNLLQIDLSSDLSTIPIKQAEEKGLMDLFASESINKIGQICEDKTQKELMANSFFELKTGANVLQTLFSNESTYVTMPRQANSSSALVVSSEVDTNEFPEAALNERASDAMHIEKCLMAENLDALIELAGGLQSFLGSEVIEETESMSEEKCLNKLPIKTKSNNCTAIDVNLMDVSTHNSSSESMQGSTSISMEKERNGIKSFSVGSKDESTKDFSGEKRIGDSSSSPTKSKKKSNIGCTEARSMNEVSDECLDNKTEESISSSGSVSFAKRAIAKEASEKSLFGTDLSDASLDSEPVVDPVPISRRRKKRRTKIAYSSESEDGGVERREGNEEQPPPGKRIKLGGKKRKSFASKCNAIFGSLSPNGSVDSVRTPDGVISQSPRRKADLPPNPSCSRAVAENTDEEGKPDDGLQSSINGSSAGPSSSNSNLNSAVTKVAIFDYNSKSDVDVPMPSVKGGHNKNSHVPIASAPPLCQGLSRIANYSPKTYASRKSKTLKSQSPILEAPKNVEAEDLNIPGKFCGVQTDNGLGANSVTSFPEEEETFSLSTKKGETVYTENATKDTESTTQIPPATSPGRRKNRKQSFIGSVRCDDATFIGEGGMAETTFLLEETGEGSLVNAVNAPGVCASASTGRKSKGTKNERVPPSPGRLNKKCGGKEDIVHDRTEQNGSTDECVTNLPKVLTTAAECGTSSAKKSSLKLRSNWRCNKDESKPSTEKGQLRSVRESVSISKLHPKARKTKSKAKSSPEFVRSSESDSEGETKSLEGGRCNELVVYVAHASEASPKLTKDRSSFVMGKGSEDKVGSSEGEGKKEKHNAGVTGMIVNLNNTTMNSRKPRMHANKNNDEDSTNLSTDQLFSLPLKKRIANIPQATECLNSLTPKILKDNLSAEGKVATPKDMKEEILNEEVGYKPPFKKRIATAPKLVAPVRVLKTQVPVNSSLSSMSLVKNENNTVLSYDQED
ncbi:serine-rich adhesin for platelets-like [Hetaerina americana]|uniref:serine-rich adhesin for platelets-like n=1 Tax=Hetaerina americana TaxID=62018 RepID=UPI003A7F6269